MKIHTHNIGNDEMAYANVQMSGAEYLELREFFHAQQDDPGRVVMPFGARLVKQGFGWYKLVNYRDNNGSKKIETAVRLIHTFHRKYMMTIAAEIRALIHIRASNSEVVAYNSNPSVPFQNRYTAIQPEQPKKVASEFQLQQLATHFSRRSSGNKHSLNGARS